ncbi:MAG TPA: triphosphoribosyl-dephospho-CoA synthase [Methanomicrobia archaeon]|nr:triphosphoribosyl-dephospho-CoA synthase [Methanomicrobia archaeon]
MNEDDVARSAQLALLLEVSAYPKPGNVDRTHDFTDTSYEHFLASSVALYPVFRDAAVRGSRRGTGLGSLVKRGVEESRAWQHGGNTHFGALLLLIPLTMAAGACRRYDPHELQRTAAEKMRRTTMEDAIDVYQAFPKARVKVRTAVPEFDLTSDAAIDEIRAKEYTLYQIFSISAAYDMISRELVGGFERTFKSAALLSELARAERINEAITHTYLHLLAAEVDTFITLKFGTERSSYVQKRAKEIVDNGCKHEELEAFDNELVRARLNPGSTADLIAAALFLCILGGLRF